MLQAIISNNIKSFYDDVISLMLRGKFCILFFTELHNAVFTVI